VAGGRDAHRGLQVCQPVGVVIGESRHRAIGSGQRVHPPRAVVGVGRQRVAPLEHLVHLPVRVIRIGDGGPIGIGQAAAPAAGVVGIADAAAVRRRDAGDAPQRVVRHAGDVRIASMCPAIVIESAESTHITLWSPGRLTVTHRAGRKLDSPGAVGPDRTNVLINLTTIMAIGECNVRTIR